MLGVESLEAPEGAHGLVGGVARAGGGAVTLVGMLAEAYLPLNDNLIIPLASGGMMELIVRSTGGS